MVLVLVAFLAAAAGAAFLLGFEAADLAGCFCPAGLVAFPFGLCFGGVCLGFAAFFFGLPFLGLVAAAFCFEAVGAGLGEVLACDLPFALVLWRLDACTGVGLSISFDAAALLLGLALAGGPAAAAFRGFPDGISMGAGKVMPFFKPSNGLVVPNLARDR